MPQHGADLFVRMVTMGRSFVRDLTIGNEAAAVVCGPGISHAVWGLPVVAEEIETKGVTLSFVFTSKRGSWLNLVDGFFSEMTRSLLLHTRVASKETVTDGLSHLGAVAKNDDPTNSKPISFLCFPSQEPHGLLTVG